ncbi:unnamed protein product [Amaranthus hypochondriacus]
MDYTIINTHTNYGVSNKRLKISHNINFESSDHHFTLQSNPKPTSSKLLDQEVIMNSFLNPTQKLYLVLDLDHTLLNTTLIEKLSSEEKYVKSQNFSGSDLFMMKNSIYVTKLRPFVHTFLEETSKMFELCIWTKGNRNYALEMAQFLDPKDIYFKERIFSREYCTQLHQKTLDVLDVSEKFIVVLDDTKTIWGKQMGNVIEIDKYHYFDSSSQKSMLKNRKSLCHMKTDEDESDGSLACILRVLKRVHSEFFENRLNEVDKDVRNVLTMMRKKVLNGCKILFGREVCCVNLIRMNYGVWEMAKEMGATCTINKLDCDITHVISLHCETEESLWALQEGKFLVNAKWVRTAFYSWQKQLENDYPVLKSEV